MTQSTRPSRPPDRAPRAASAPRLAVPALLVLVVTCAAHAQPTSRPSASTPTRPHLRGGGGSGGPGGGPVTAEDVEAAMEFARRHMPNLAGVIEDAEPGSLTRRKMTRFAIERWRAVERVQREDPDAYEAALARATSHDEVFDLIRQLDEAAADQRPALRARVREKMRQVMLDLLEERERRIEGLRRMLGREEDLLSRDRANLDELTERRVRMLQDEMGVGGGSGGGGGTVPKSAGDLTPPDLSDAPASPVDPSTSPSPDRPRRDR